MTDDVMDVGKVRVTHNVFCGLLFLTEAQVPVGRVGVEEFASVDRGYWRGNEVRVN